MHPQDLYSLLVPSHPVTSPDGSSVAFAVARPRAATNDYESFVRVIGLGGERAEQHASAGGRRESWPCWHPGGGELAIVSDAGCDTAGAARIWRVELVTSAAHPITPAMLGIRDLAWSPCGNLLAFTARGPDGAHAHDGVRRVRDLAYRSEPEGWCAGEPRQVYLVHAAEGGAPARMSDETFEHRGLSWTADGLHLITVSARHDFRDLDKVTHLYRFALRTKEWTQLTDTPGQCASPACAPEGQAIAFFYNASPYYSPTNWQLALLESAQPGACMRLLTEQETLQCRPLAEHQQPVWTRRGEILFAVEHRGRSRLLRVNARGDDAPCIVLDADGTISAVTGTAERPLVVKSDSHEPEEVWASSRPLTSFGRGFPVDGELKAAMHFLAPAEGDAQVDAWIIPPHGLPGIDGAPVIVSVHGGPYSQYGRRFLDEFQAYARAGFAVVYCNPRGSSGYGQSWGRAIATPFGGTGFAGVDMHDVIAVIDTALERFPYCDSQRLNLIGGSYGATLAAHILARCDRFRAACLERGAHDFCSLLGTSDLGLDFTQYFGSPGQDSWTTSSSLQIAGAIGTPVLIVHSDDDIRVPVGQSEQLFSALRSRRRVVEMLRFQAGGHELSRRGPPRYRVARLEAIIEWFMRWS